MASLPTRILSHQQRVCALYKEALRQLQSFYPERHFFRYHAVLLRNRFDQNAVETDMRKARKMLVDGESELREKSHVQRIRFPTSPGGSAYDRKRFVPDWVLDMWHPYEKAAYPEYFAKRESRKKEYIEWWERKYGESASAKH